MSGLGTIESGTGGAAKSARHVDYHDAVRSSDPVCRAAGLALDLSTRMVPAPLALFIARAGDRNPGLLVVKADAGLGADQALLEPRYLVGGAGACPILDSIDSQLPVSLINRDEMEEAEPFSESEFATELLPRFELESMVVLHFRPQPDEPDAAIVLFRGRSEPDFTDRERNFLRHSGPVLAHSFHCALEADTGPPERTGTLSVLTKREYEIAQLAARGSRNDEIATALHISPGTVKTHLRNIYSKLDVDSRIHLSMRLSGH